MVVFLVSKALPALLILGMILINAYFVWRGASKLPHVVRSVDVDPPDIAVPEPPMNTTIHILNNTVRIHAEVRASDEGGLRNMYIVMARKLSWDEEGVIWVGPEEIRTKGAEMLENWPTPKIDISDEYTNAEYNLPRKIGVLYNVDYVDEQTCVVDLDITIENCEYYGIRPDEEYWVIFVVEDKAGNLAWNSSLLITSKNKASGGAPESNVIPEGSIRRGHPALYADYPYVPYMVDRQGETWVIGTVEFYGEAYYWIQFTFISSVANATIRTRKGIYAVYGNTGAGFMAGFLLMIPWDKKGLLDAFVGMGFLEFDVGSVVRFYLKTWSFFLTVWACWVYLLAAMLVAALARRLRLRRRRVAEASE